MSQRPRAGSWGAEGLPWKLDKGEKCWGDVDGKPSPAWGLGGKHGAGGGGRTKASSRK